MSLYLAIDQSTSATKALLFNADGALLDSNSIAHQQIYPRAGWVEHDALEILQNSRKAMAELLSRHYREVAQIRSISLTNQRETVVVFNKADSVPLANAVVWQCRRSTEICERHLKAGCGDRVRQLTGLRIDPYFSASKLQWLIENNPQIAQALRDGSALAGTMDTLLIHALTGGQVFATDATNACRTLLYDIDTLDWSGELCELWNVPSSALAEVRDSTAEFGSTDLFGLLPAPVPIHGVMGDSHAALLAHRCFTPGSTKVTMGTGSSLLMNIGPQRRESSSGVLTTLAWVHDGKPTYAFEGIIISAASTLTWMRDQLGIISDMTTATAEATALPDNGGVHVVPAFTGLGLPHWQPQARAAILGLTSQSDRRHVVRAGIESIGFQIQDAIAAMRADADTGLASLHADGGSTINAFLMQFIADLTRADLHVPAMAEFSALGAVYAGMWGSGALDSQADLDRLPMPEIIYSPKLPQPAATELTSAWNQAVAQALHGLN